MPIVNANDLNLTEYMAPNKDGIQTYITAVDEAVQSGRYEGPLTTRCPECGTRFHDLDEAYEDSEHIIMTTTSDTMAVLVGCEGYFVVDPNGVGIPSPNWTPAEHYGYGI